MFRSIGGLSGLEEASQREANERSGRPREELEEGDNDEPSRTDPLTERQINEVSLAIEIFGMEMVRERGKLILICTLHIVYLHASRS